VTDEPTIPTLPHLPDEAGRVADAAAEAGLALALVGGIGVWMRCPSARVPPLARDYGDIDLVGHARDRKAIVALMESLGYTPDGMFNALHGASRLNFTDEHRDRPVDVLLDTFRMAHELELADRFGPGDRTLPLADLLLTKLQIVSLNEKDVRDLGALLADHPLGGPDAIELPRILDATRGDWGLERTVHGTLQQLRGHLPGLGLERDVLDRVVARTQELDRALAEAPKSRRWKMRARVGERVRWYEEPEEAR